MNTLSKRMNSISISSESDRKLSWCSNDDYFVLNTVTNDSMDMQTYNHFLDDIVRCLQPTLKTNEDCKEPQFDSWNRTLDLCIKKLTPQPLIYSPMSKKNRVSEPILQQNRLSFISFSRRKSNNPSLSRARTPSLGSTLTSQSPNLEAQCNESSITVGDVNIEAITAGVLNKLFVGSGILNRKTWKRRFFVLTSSSLIRFKTEGRQTTAAEWLDFDQSSYVCVSEVYPGRNFVLEIGTKSTAWFLQADCSEDLKIWFKGIKAQLTRIKFEVMALPSIPTQLNSLPTTRRASNMCQPPRLLRANSQPIAVVGGLCHFDRPMNSPLSPSTLGLLKCNKINRLSANSARRPSLAPLKEDNMDCLLK